MGKSDFSLYISFLSGPEEGKEIKLSAGEAIVGRSDDCTVTVKHVDISRKHLKIVVDQNRIHIQDLGSSNGTFVNGTRLVPNSPSRVEPSDKITLGKSVTFLVRTPSKSGARKSVKKVADESFSLDFDPPPRLPPASAQHPPSPPVAPSPASKEESPKQSRNEFAHPLLLEARQKAEDLIDKAKREAALIVQKAAREAEEKVQSFYERARTTENQANDLYAKRLIEAKNESAKIFEKANSEASEIISEARKQAQSVREKAELFVAKMQSEAREKVQKMLNDAESQIDEELAKREMELIATTREKLDAEARLKSENLDQELKSIKKKALSEVAEVKAETEILLKKREEAQSRYEKALKENNLLTDEVEKRTQLVASLSAELKKQSEQLDKTINELGILTSEKKNVEFNISELISKSISLKNEVEKLANDKTKLESEIEKSTKDHALRLQTQKQEFEKRKAKIEDDEKEFFAQGRVETLRNLQNLKKELFSEIDASRVKLSRELALTTESILQKIIPKTEWRENADLLEEAFQKVLHSPSSVDTDGQEAPDSHNELIRARKREKFRLVSYGLFAGVAIVLGATFVQKNIKIETAPMERFVASAIEKQKNDLKARKFDPPKTLELRESYTDSVIYTKGYVELYSDPQFQTALGKSTARHLLKTFQVSEERSMNAIARISALVSALEEKKQNIHPDFVQKGLGQMKELETQTLNEIAADLGSNVRLEALREEEQKFIEEWRKK